MQSRKDVAILYGVIAGDGCLSVVGKKKFISITGNFYDDKQFFERIVLPILKRLRGKETKYRDRQNQGKIEINFVDPNLFDIINGLEFPVCKKGKKLHVPDILKNNIKYITMGYFATDGSIVLTNNNGILYPRLEIQSLSKKMLRQISLYLKSIGMNGNVYTVKRENYQDVYRLQFNGLDNLMKFKQKVGFLNPKHNDKFENFIRSRSSSAVERYTVKGDAHKAMR